MISTSRPIRPRHATQDVVRQLRITAYERASGWVTSLLIVFGCFMVVMFAFWLTSQVWNSDPSNPQPPVEGLAGGGNQAPEQVVLDEPKKEEIQTADELPMDVTVEAVTDAVSTLLAQLDALMPRSRGDEPGKGDGHSGPPRGYVEIDIVPRWERWEIRFDPVRSQIYAQQLDCFGIELGAVGGSNQNIDLASGFSTGNPQRSSKLAAAETRLYMTWREGTLANADHQLLNLAGIPTDDRIVMQLYPKQLENELALLERAYAGRRDIRSVKKTIFGIRPAGDRFEFFVMDQRYRLYPKDTAISN